jgi:hypothetical protein
LAPRVSTVIGTIVVALGAIFLIFGIAPSFIPGGLPTGFLEFGGKHANIVESGGGAAIMVVGGAVRKFGVRHRTITAAGVIVVLLLSIVSFASTFSSNFVLTTINITVQYGSNDQGYFGPAQQTLPIATRSGQSLTVDEGSPFSISFSLRESSLAGGNDSITSIEAVVPDFAFTVASVSPALPIAFSPGSSALINVSLVAPFYNMGQACPPNSCHPNYNGPISLVLTTTGG